MVGSLIRFIRGLRIFMHPQISAENRRRLNFELYKEYLSWARYAVYMGSLLVLIYGLWHFFSPWSTLKPGRIRWILGGLDIAFSIFLFICAFIMRRQKSKAIKTQKPGVSDYVLFLSSLWTVLGMTILQMRQGIIDLSTYLLGIAALTVFFRISEKLLFSLIVLTQAVFSLALIYLVKPVYPGIDDYIFTYIYHTTSFAAVIFFIRRALGSTRINLLLRDIRLEENEKHIMEHNLMLEKKSDELKQLNDELLKVSEIDFLTGLANRRKLDDMYAREWARSMRSREPVTIMIVDVDQFEKVNLVHGQEKGDEILKIIGQALRSAARRRTDLTSRYGGDEFVILLPDTDVDGAAIFAQRLISCIQNLQIPRDTGDDGPEIQTVSVGAAVIWPARGLSPNSLFVLADAALCKAKAAGRNTYRIETAG
ncbi:MAG TPA: hypothetical protein DD727_04565 [Clostridiales bacterium]|nr:hypothetical protein [Clostridiales bacterium]